MLTFKKDRISLVLNIGLILLFALLLFKDPFSSRTLIPNFEPYPDTFNYINPALNFINGKGFNMGREGRRYSSNVPPLYSFSLIPFFVLKPDPRMAYYTNFTSAFLSLVFFWLILRRIFSNKLTKYALLILYVTNYFIYWMPSLVMAENLTLTLYLAAIYFLLSKSTGLNIVLLAFIAVGMYATKFANIPITGMIALLFLAKVLFNVDGLAFKQRFKVVLLFLGSLLSCFLAFILLEQFTNGNNVFSQIYRHLFSIYNSVPKSDTGSKVEAASWFGIQYIRQNLPLYFGSLIGQPNKFLWDSTPLVPSFAAIFGSVGIMLSAFNKKYRFVSLSFLAMIVSLIMFMSTFYSMDARYIYIAIPTLIIGFGMFLNLVVHKIIKANILFNVLVLALIVGYLGINFARIKNQISLNLRHAETPWNYIAVLKLNEYFTPDKIKNGNKPIVISAQPPFLVDYYSNGNYTLLPLSYEQDFRAEDRSVVWGPNDYSDLPKLYKKYLLEGYEVYVSRAGLGNEGYTNRDFNAIVEKFDTKLVQEGCFNQCNIYSVKLKKNDQ